MLLDDPLWVQELSRWGSSLPKPKAILMVSAHWETRPAALSSTNPLPLIYDFYGFPTKYYELTYGAPGAPELANRLRRLLRDSRVPFRDDPERGLDHGAYIPLMCMYPSAEVPVLQLSLPSLDPKQLMALGMSLAPLREEGVLVIGSGFLTHNLRTMGHGETPAWAKEFDDWIGDVLQKRDMDSLLDYRRKAPAVSMAHPTHEHFVPVIVAAGASALSSVAPTFPITGFWYSSFTKRSVQYG